MPFVRMAGLVYACGRRPGRLVKLLFPGATRHAATTIILAAFSLTPRHSKGNTMRVLITGGRGMLARSLVQVLNQEKPSLPDPFDAFEVTAPGRDGLDITDPVSVGRVFAELQPQVVLHCAAWTKVDLAESHQEEVQVVNVQGSANVAQASKQVNARLIAFSTDYVFDGESGPYTEFSTPTGGINVYGQTKWAAERAIRLNCPNHLIARVSWLYGPGGPSFVHTMLRLHKEGKSPLRVVDDQTGSPTSTLAVARSIAEILQRPHLAGTFHLACAGQTTWFRFARTIFELAGLSQEILPCRSEEFPTPARRPANSCLASLRMAPSGLAPLPSWQDALKEFLALELPVLGL